jgi:hypothetical protein
MNIVDVRTAELDFQIRDNWRLTAENEYLKDKNAKLCKLVAKAHACKTDEGCCEGCYQDDVCCPIEREMQELGIETDD